MRTLILAKFRFGRSGSVTQHEVPVVLMMLVYGVDGKCGSELQLA